MRKITFQIVYEFPDNTTADVMYMFLHNLTTKAPLMPDGAEPKLVSKWWGSMSEEI